ncbi:MAG: hypothetical protein V2A65_10490 [Candidatus Omnitrophota bacterium]
MEMAVENARKEGHLVDRDSMPQLYTDNDSGFTSKLMPNILPTTASGISSAPPTIPRVEARLKDLTAGSRKTSAFWSTALQRS